MHTIALPPTELGFTSQEECYMTSHIPTHIPGLTIELPPTQPRLREATGLDKKL